MKLLVAFDLDADIIDVPQIVIEQKDHYASRFYKWLSNKGVRHSYWVTFEDGTKGLCFRADALVEWLNKKVLLDFEEKAVILHQHVAIEEHSSLPSIFF